MKKLKYTKIRENAKDPERAHKMDAGFDVFYAPEKKGRTGVLRPGQNKVLGTGLKFEIPEGYMLQVMNRSSMATDGIIRGAHVVDAGYEGELLINLHTTNKQLVKSFSGTEKEFFWPDPYVIKPGDKIAQVVVQPVYTPELEEVNESKLYEGIDNERGEGGFGSTGG